MNFNDLEDAFLFVSSGTPFEHTAMVSKKTGQVCLRSEMGDLVFAFVAQRLPADLDRVEAIFSRKGAYSRYKDLLEKRGVLEEWYEYENASLKEAILQWCRDEGIEVTE